MPKRHRVWILIAFRIDTVTRRGLLGSTTFRRFLSFAPLRVVHARSPNQEAQSGVKRFANPNSQEAQGAVLRLYA